MKKILTLLFVSFICVCAFSQGKPKKGESIGHTVKRTELSDEVLEYGKNIVDSDDNYFFSRKYGSASTASWNCHDPKIFQDDDGTYYVYSTGWNEGVQIRSSKDLVHWTKHVNSAFWDPKDISLKYRHMHWDDEFLRWCGYVTNDGTSYRTDWYNPSGKPNSWAPTVYKQNGKYYMFHGIITDCLSSGYSLHPAACISLSIADSPVGPFIPAAKYDPETYKNSTLVRYVWTTSNAQHSQIGYEKSRNSGNGAWEFGFGAIDPEFVMDIDTGRLMEYEIGSTKCYAMTYGSWKGGIALIYVDAQTFKPVNQKTGAVLDAALDSLPDNSGIQIAGGVGSAYEGSQLIYSSKTGYYYIFVSMGDLNIEYRVGVGRSKKIEGPYLDTRNLAMKNPAGYHAIGGKIIGAYHLGNDYGFKSLGGQSILRNSKGKILFACHSRTDYMPVTSFTLQVREMLFTETGWPVLNMNEYYDDSETSFTMDDLAGTYDLIITKRDSDSKVDGTATPSVQVKIDEEGNLSGGFKGKLILADDGKTIKIDMKGNGIFSGFVLPAYDQARKNITKPEDMKTIAITALCAEKGTYKGEYLFGNKIK